MEFTVTAVNMTSIDTRCTNTCKYTQICSNMTNMTFKFIFRGICIIDCWTKHWERENKSDTQPHLKYILLLIHSSAHALSKECVAKCQFSIRTNYSY